MSATAGRAIARAPEIGELVIASNRLPVQVTVSDAGAIDLTPSAGGLVNALRGVATPFTWVGWPGAVVPAAAQAELADRLAADRLEPVFLEQADEAGFYGRICNDTIWPLFHDFVGRMSFTDAAWERYVDVNRRFAEQLAACSAHGARVWVHDFHLMLVPAALRELRPDLSIGFFLHIPFPSAESFRLLPSRKEVLLGLLGADHVGFHTSEYARHFRSSCLHVLGIDSEPDGIEHGGRVTGIGADPIGIDVAHFCDLLARPETAAMVDELTARYRGQRLVLGVERLDYSKGVPQKLRAFERFLEDDPTRAETTTLLQVLVPSRLESADYRELRAEIEQESARINARFGRPGRTPVECLHRSVSPAELVALYRRADVMAVTPLRDGMNLVAQEFVLCQTAAPKLPGRARGVLLLSEFAGAAQVLPGALLVNPWDTADLAARLVEALALEPAERRRRFALMSGAVRRLAAPRWAEGCLDRLAQAEPVTGTRL